MDIIPAGIQSLHGASDKPYAGKRGQERWNKMKDNVVREWEEEQRKKNAANDGVDKAHIQSAEHIPDSSAKNQTDTKESSDINTEISTSQDKDRSRIGGWLRKKFGGGAT